MSLYRVQEGSFDLDGTWQDRSVTMLVPAGLPEGANLILTRDELPPEGGFDDHLARQMMSLRREMPGFTLLEESAVELDGRPARLVEFRWVNRDTPLYQMMLVALEDGRLLNFTATCPGAVADAETRKSLWKAISSFKFAPAPELVPA
jgi:hypothetical protein